jgi:hypothetical protein
MPGKPLVWRVENSMNLANLWNMNGIPLRMTSSLEAFQNLPRVHNDSRIRKSISWVIPQQPSESNQQQACFISCRSWRLQNQPCFPSSAFHGRSWADWVCWVWVTFWSRSLTCDTPSRQRSLVCKSGEHGQSPKLDKTSKCWVYGGYWRFVMVCHQRPLLFHGFMDLWCCFSWQWTHHHGEHPEDRDIDA